MQNIFIHKQMVIERDLYILRLKLYILYIMKAFKHMKHYY